MNAHIQPSPWLVVVSYADEVGTTDVVGCSSYAQARDLVDAVQAEISAGGVHSVALLDSEKRVLFDSAANPHFDTWLHIPTPGKYRFDSSVEKLVSMGR